MKTLIPRNISYMNLSGLDSSSKTRLYIYIRINPIWLPLSEGQHVAMVTYQSLHISSLFLLVMCWSRAFWSSNVSLLQKNSSRLKGNH